MTRGAYVHEYFTTQNLNKTTNRGYNKKFRKYSAKLVSLCTEKILDLRLGEHIA